MRCCVPLTGLERKLADWSECGLPLFARELFAIFCCGSFRDPRCHCWLRWRAKVNVVFGCRTVLKGCKKDEGASRQLRKKRATPTVMQFSSLFMQLEVQPESDQAIKFSCIMTDSIQRWEERETRWEKHIEACHFLRDFVAVFESRCAMGRVRSGTQEL